MTVDIAVREAVDWAISKNFLEGYIREQKEEIIGMILEEYDEQACIETWQEDGFIKGHKEGLKEGAQEKSVENAITLINEFNVTPEVAAEKMGAPLEMVLASLKK